MWASKAKCRLLGPRTYLQHCDINRRWKRMSPAGVCPLADCWCWRIRIQACWRSAATGPAAVARAVPMPVGWKRGCVCSEGAALPPSHCRGQVMQQHGGGTTVNQNSGGCRPHSPGRHRTKEWNKNRATFHHFRWSTSHLETPNVADEA